MKMVKKKTRSMTGRLVLLTALLLGSSVMSVSAAPKTTTKKDDYQLTILGTSDVHGQLWNWSYEDDKATPVGLAQVSTVVNEARKENPNGTIVIDNGDILQGTILTDDLYNRAPLIDEQHPMVAAMNHIGYDAMTLGNHEFNFGLDLIQKLKKEANFPILSANIYQKENNKRFVQGTALRPVDLDNDQIPDVTVGIIGLTTPHIPKWDGAKVDTLSFLPLKEEAEKAVHELQGKADIVVASIHAGKEDPDPAASANEVIKKVAGIDAYILGHDHRSFAETMNGPDGPVPVGAPKDTGIEMVRIDLTIKKEQQNWAVQKHKVAIVDTKTYPADETLKEQTKTYHETTQQFIAKEIGTATASFLPQEEVKGIPEAQLRPTAMISLINRVQRKVTGAQLSASALFKADSELNAGPISYANVFDIYKYPNTLVSVPILGEKLLVYMEEQAAYYQTPEPDDLTIAFQAGIRVYNYDIFSGVTYKIDISKPIGSRIVNPTIDGKPVDPKATYTIAMNNYRYEGLLDKGIVTAEPLMATDPDTLRGFIAAYIKDKGTLNPAEELEENWEIIGYNFPKKWRDLAVQLVNEGKLQTQTSADGRTPNVVPITKKDVAEKGLHPDTVTIMHTNDIHGRLQGNQADVLGMARLKTFQTLQAPELLIDSGDAFQGLPISNFSKGMDMAEIMNQVGYDAMAVGNHEFDFGLDAALALRDKLTFPLLSNNTYKGKQLLFKPYTIIQKYGKKYAVIGVTTPETATKTHPQNIVGVTFSEPIEATKQTIADILKNETDIDAFIVAGHLGVDPTTPEQWRGDTLAQALSTTYKDLPIAVLDGHSHTAFPNGKNFGAVMYAQTGNYLNNIGMTTLHFTDSSKHTATLTEAQSLAHLPEDASVKALADQAALQFDTWGKEVIIPQNPYQFNGARENVRTRETNLGNLIGDAMLAYGQTGFNEPTDFAVTNGGGIRASIEPGAVTLADTIAVLPFGNRIVQIKVTGAQVKEMFEFSVRAAAEKTADGEVVLDAFEQPKLSANGGFLHVSNSIRVYYDATKKRTLMPNEDTNASENTMPGERVLHIEIFDRNTQTFRALDEQATYTMATNDFIAAGGDGYTMLGGETEEGPSLDTVLIDFLKQTAAVRLLRTNTQANLADYKEAFPNARIVSISEANFKKQNQTPEVPKPEEKPNEDTNKTPQPQPQPVTDAPSANDSQQQLSNGNKNTAKAPTYKLPATGEAQNPYAILGIVLLGLSVSSYFYFQKRTA